MFSRQIFSRALGFAGAAGVFGFSAYAHANGAAEASKTNGRGGLSASLIAKLGAKVSNIQSALDARPPKRPGVLAAVGNTPLIELRSLSAATGCRILAKCEHLNPGGSVKDRAALWMIEDAERKGALRPGGTVCEGTGGNTGVGLALVAAAKGYAAVMAMPATIAQEKINAMRVLGARVVLCPGVPFTDARHYFHRAAAIAAETDNAIFTNQFDNLANMRCHLEGTAPEIWRQSGGKVDGFVCAAGTGGTIAGCSAFLKSANPACACYVIDPPGSALFDFVTRRLKGEDTRAKEATPVGVPTTFIPRSEGNSVTEGIGIGRVTANFSNARLDGALSGTDREAIEMAYHLIEHDGVFVGPSAALNAVGAVKLARKLGPGHTVVTVLCDGGARYRSKMYTASWLAERGLTPRASGGFGNVDFVK